VPGECLSFLEVLGLEVDFVDGWRCHEEDGGLVGGDGGVGDDFLDVFTVSLQGNVLEGWAGRETGIVGAEEEELCCSGYEHVAVELGMAEGWPVGHIDKLPSWQTLYY
jgi:hypothetical protein